MFEQCLQHDEKMFTSCKKTYDILRPF